MWRLGSITFVFVLLLQACTVFIPINGVRNEVGYEVIIQTEQRHLKSLSKEYRKLNWTELRTLSVQAGMYLILIFPGNRDPELVISDLRRDVRIQQAEWNKPLNRR